MEVGFFILEISTENTATKRDVFNINHTCVSEPDFFFKLNR